jgi:hypothetical protein
MDLLDVSQPFKITHEFNSFGSTIEGIAANMGCCFPDDLTVMGTTTRTAGVSGTVPIETFSNEKGSEEFWGIESSDTNTTSDDLTNLWGSTQ